MSDLSILYYTANLLPPDFAEAVREQLRIAVARRFPIITIAQGESDFGDTIIDVGPIGASVLNLYRQVLIGAKAATTPFVALCEDDALYTPGHFTCYRPPLDTFGYNHHKWALYQWGKPVFSRKKNRSVLNQCLAPRDLLVEALEERFAKVAAGAYDEERIKANFAEPGRYEKWLRVTIRKLAEFWSPEPNIIISHRWALGYQVLGRRKALGKEQTDRIEPWGTAEDVRHRFCGGQRRG